MTNSTVFSDESLANFFDISYDDNNKLVSSSNNLGFTELLGFQDYYTYEGSLSSSLFDLGAFTSSITLPHQPSEITIPSTTSTTQYQQSQFIPQTSEVLNNSTTTPNTPNSSDSVSSSSNELAPQNEEQSKPQVMGEAEADNQEKPQKQ